MWMPVSSPLSIIPQILAVRWQPTRGASANESGSRPAADAGFPARNNDHLPSSRKVMALWCHESDVREFGAGAAPLILPPPSWPSPLSWPCRLACAIQALPRKPTTDETGNKAVEDEPVSLTRRLPRRESSDRSTPHTTIPAAQPPELRVRSHGEAARRSVSWGFACEVAALRRDTMARIAQKDQ